MNPWYTDLSLRILQDFIFGSGDMDNVLQVSIDFENMLNLFSSELGRAPGGELGGAEPADLHR